MGLLRLLPLLLLLLGGAHASGGSEACQKAADQLKQICGANAQCPAVTCKHSSDEEVLETCCPKEQELQKIQKPKIRKARLCGRSLARLMVDLCPDGCSTGNNIAAIACSVSHSHDELQEMCCPSK